MESNLNATKKIRKDHKKIRSLARPIQIRRPDRTGPVLTTDPTDHKNIVKLYWFSFKFY